MQYQTFVTLGKASITPSGLRCQGPRLKQPDQPCQKLIAKKNSAGQIAGSFKCERCKQVIEIVIKANTEK